MKEVRCDILKAFAIVGALAWQATIIKMLVLCAGWEIARGVFIPGFCHPFVSLCPAYDSSRRVSNEWSYSATQRYNWI
jgi:hypothetical protein|uniref:Uncharacterized protein n=1 Tax=Zea mays TaxID=4577 RepID=B4FKX5_MAIZE|nr:unknown [Zea mays]ACN25524.1 unknown [Zea mays]